MEAVQQISRYLARFRPLVRAFVFLAGSCGLAGSAYAQITERFDSEEARPSLQTISPSDLRLRAESPPSEWLGADSTTRFIPWSGEMAVLRQRLSQVFGPRMRGLDAEGRMVVIQAAGRPIAEISFDERRRGVLATGTDSVLNQLQALLDAMDTRRLPSNRRMAVVSIERSDRAKLQQAIDAYRALNRPRPSAREDKPAPSSEDGAQTFRRTRDGGLALVNFVLQEDAGAPAAGDAAEPTEGTVEVPVTTPGLDVDVEVQTLPDLDVIILRGNDRDVQRLTEVIQELERLSRETQPRIEIYHLQHANSESVSEVIQDISEDLTGRRQGRVSVTPLVKPNSLLLIGWGDAIESMLELIQKLDTPVSPQTEFEVFRLKHAAADNVQTAITQFFAGRQGLGPTAQVVADPRSNSVVVSAAPRDMEEVRRLVESLDIPGSESVNLAKVIRIQHALAQDLSDTLQEAINATGTGAGPNAMLELLTIGDDEEQKIRSGVLSDVRITTNVRNNSLIVSGPEDSIALIEELVRQLDTPGDVSQIKVFRILNGDAASLVTTLRSLIPAQLGVQLGPQPPTTETESSLAPLRFSVDTRTNSIIAVGSDGDLQIVEALLLRLDEQDLAERKNEVYRLRNAPALDVALAVNEFLRSERVIQQAAPGVDSYLDQIEREVVVVPEPVGNSLIISATARYFDEIHRLVVELDEQPPQVMIQVLIAEVRLNGAREFGVELGIQDSVLFDRSLLGDLLTTVNTVQGSTPAGIITSTEEVIQAASNTPGYNFNNQPLGNSGSTKSLAASDRVGGQALSHFAVGRVNSELGFGGLVLSASSESVSVLIRALQESRRVDVLSRPQVRTLDNQPAFIQVGQRVPRIVASNVVNGGLQTNSIELENVGLILGVTPRISPDGMVVMEVDAERSSLGSEQEGIPITVSQDGTVIRSPTINTTTAQTTVSAASGETIILGGLITNESLKITRRVPYLAEIPLLGELFRYDGEEDVRNELLIILTPHVIKTPADSQRINQTEMARMSWCAADVFAMHGQVEQAYDHGLQNETNTEVIYPDLNPRGNSTETPVDSPDRPWESTPVEPPLDEYESMPLTPAIPDPPEPSFESSDQVSDQPNRLGRLNPMPQLTRKSSR